MNKILTLIAIACFIRNACAQQQNRRFFRRQVAPSRCVTPENYYGQCVTLSYCPQIASVFQTRPQRVAQQYVIAAQQRCGVRSVNNDPVVCCTRPLTQPTQNNRPTQPPIQPPTQPPPPFTQPTNNPFIRPQTSPTTQTVRPEATTRQSASQVDSRATYCRGPDTLEGTCTELRNCNRLLEELKVKQRDQEFANYLRASNRICGSRNQEVCCPSENQSSNNTPRTPTPPPFSNDVPRRLPTVEEGCGYTSNTFKKIVGGEVSKPGAWPWAVLIGYEGGSPTSQFKCGGALVSARHVITAAHCILRDLSFVRLGEHDLLTDSEAKHVDINVVKREAHPEYNKKNGRSDIAILYLERNVPFSNTIAPICLPSSQQLRTKSYKSYMPFVVGWGKTMEGGRSSNVLQELQIPIFDNQVCVDSYRKANRLFSSNQFDAAVLCAGVLAGGKDTCQGDSGGPLMAAEPYQTSTRFYLIGVVSYGIGCARPNVPGVYTSTQYFMDWIIQKVAETT